MFCCRLRWRTGENELAKGLAKGGGVVAKDLAKLQNHHTSTLIGLGLDNFIIDGNALSKTIDEKETTKSNPEYIVWYRQDQILFSAILGSCSDEIQSVIASALTAKEA
ncbi:hypothetical protein Tco_1423596 [Tanacetum coccineum]